jgi:hypothetical protein
MSAAALIAALLAGLLGGVHCVAMCGGFVTAMAGARPAAPLLPASRLVGRLLPYNLGRVATYTLLGALAGGLGAAVLGAAAWLPLVRGLYVVANVFLLLLAATIAFRIDPWTSLQRGAIAAFGRIAPAVGRLATRDAPAARFATGLLWGLVPCGLVYGVIPVALFAGGPAEGALVMAAFGAGTLPNLLAAGVLVGRLRAWLDRRAVRYGAALLLVAFALAGLYRALFGAMALGQGPFCIVP